MKDLQHDLEIARSIMDDYDDYYGVEPDRLYLRSNEPLDFIFANIDVLGKDVLSVLASSDQLFSFCYGGAKSVDCFDINPLTEYYYYLRRFAIEQGLGPYPYDFNNEKLRDLLKKVKPKTPEEQQAVKFWLRLEDEYRGLMYGPLFFSVFPAGNTTYEGREEGLIDVLPQKSLTFRNQNIFNPFDMDSTYDIIYTSNILENARGSVRHLKVCRDNLDKLLNPGGIVVSTRVLRDGEDNMALREREIFEEVFDYVPGASRISNVTGRRDQPYYVYQKK